MANDLSDISDILGAKGDVSDVSDILGAPVAEPKVSTKRSISDIMRGKGLKEQDLAYGIEAAKAVGRGTVKGVIGAPGALEQFGAYTVPEFFGAQPTPSEKRTEIFPTPETVGKMMQQVGLGETPEKYKSAESLFEVLGGLYSPPATEVGKLAGTVAKETGRAVRGAVSPEASLAARIAEPTSSEKLGKSIFDKVSDRLKNLREGRSEEAKALFENFYRDAKPVENYIREGYIQDLKNYLIQNQGKLSSEKVKVIQDAIKSIAPDAKIEALDEERRLLADMIDPAATGADVIRNEAYKTAHDLLLKNITDRVKSASDTYSRYAELSKEINQFGTTLGKKFTRKAGEYLPEIGQIEPETIPAAAFKNKSTVANLKRLSGDPAFVEDAARQHIANDLEGKTSPSQVRAYIQRNDWLGEVPEVKKELEGLASELSRGKKLRYGAAAGLGLYAGRGVLDKLGKFFGD